MFKTVETIKTNEGKSHENGLEVVLEKEDDGKWRVRQERILPPEEVEHDKLLEGL
jgi:ketosteroid isomerase-like protein